jgi:DNA-binding beta-propeller fold protein YncE
MRRLAVVLPVLTLACATTPRPAKDAASAHGIALPGAPPDGVFLDYIAYDAAHHRVWVPAGNTGSVDVIDDATGKVSRIEGFPTAEMERRGQKRLVGPSSASVGDGYVYVGNRGDSSVCAIDAGTFVKADCAQLDSMPDGVAYVGATHEVWVTTPRHQTITIVDASRPPAPTVKGTIQLPGDPEGYAVDGARGLFYTNLEDKDRTLAIDLRTHEIVHSWTPGCGQDGPRGLALDPDGNRLFVACTDHVVLLDAGHDGKQLAQVATGPGVDNIDYLPGRHELFAAAARAATLTIARLGAGGTLTAVAVVPTSPGARNPVATERGTAYLTDSRAGRVLVVTPGAGR